MKSFQSGLFSYVPVPNHQSQAYASVPTATLKRRKWPRQICKKLSAHIWCNEGKSWGPLCLAAPSLNHVCSRPKCLKPWYKFSGVSLLVPGTMESYILQISAVDEGPYGERDIVILTQLLEAFFATQNEIKEFQQSSCRLVKSWLSAKLIIRNS